MFQFLFSTGHCEWVGDSAYIMYYMLYVLICFRGDLSFLLEAERAGIAFVVLFLIQWLRLTQLCLRSFCCICKPIHNGSFIYSKSCYSELSCLQHSRLNDSTVCSLYSKGNQSGKMRALKTRCKVKDGPMVNNTTIKILCHIILSEKEEIFPGLHPGLLFICSLFLYWITVLNRKIHNFLLWKAFMHITPTVGRSLVFGLNVPIRVVSRQTLMFIFDGWFCVCIMTTVLLELQHFKAFLS